MGQTAGVPTDGCPNVTGKIVGDLMQSQDKMTKTDIGIMHCIIHQQESYMSVLEMTTLRFYSLIYCRSGSVLDLYCSQKKKALHTYSVETLL